MGQLTVGAETVWIAEGWHSVQHVPLADTERGYQGTLNSAITASRGHFRVWTFQTPSMAIADVQALEGELDDVGGITVNGALVGGSPLTCHARNVRRVYPRPYSGFASLAFELWESEP